MYCTYIDTHQDIHIHVYLCKYIYMYIYIYTVVDTSVYPKDTDPMSRLTANQLWRSRVTGLQQDRPVPLCTRALNHSLTPLQVKGIQLYGIHGFHIGNGKHGCAQIPIFEYFDPLGSKLTS